MGEGLQSVLGRSRVCVSNVNVVYFGVFSCIFCASSVARSRDRRSVRLMFRVARKCLALFHIHCP